MQYLSGCNILNSFGNDLVKISEDIAFSFYKEIYMKYLILRFAHSPKNVIFLLGRLIFSLSINSHPDNIYISTYIFHTLC